MKYYVLTWDIDRQTWMPQKGVRKGPWSKWGLREALRRLQAMGYDTHRRSAYSIMICADEPTTPLFAGPDAYDIAMENGTLWPGCEKEWARRRQEQSA